MSTQTKRRSTSKKQTGKKKSRGRQTPETNRLWSVLVFALALILLALTFIKGAAGWSRVQGTLFGLFGCGLYLLSPLLLYLAVLIAAGHPYKLKLLESGITLLLLCGIGLLFSAYNPVDYPTFSEKINALYVTGTNRNGGGVFAAPLGLSLLCWAGRPAGNIILLILLIIFIMLLTDITPADIVYYLRGKAHSARESANAALLERDSRREEKRQQRAQQEDTSRIVPLTGDGFERPKVAPDLPTETSAKKRDRWNIDINLSQGAKPDAPAAPAPAQPVVTAPGGAFEPEHCGDISSVLRHDMLVAAGREALQPHPKPVTVTPSAVPVHKPLYDQENEAAHTPAPETGGLFLRIGAPGDDEEDETAEIAAPASAELFPRPQTEPAGSISPSVPETPLPQTLENRVPSGEKAEADDAHLSQESGESRDQVPGEIDDLIRKAINGKTPEPLSTDADTAREPGETPAAPQPRPYHLPSPELLDRQVSVDQGNINEEMKQNAAVLVSTLESFGVKTRMLDICRGPSVTRYELQPLAGVKISRITSLSDDIALNLATAGVRIEAPIPGKPAVGIEVPNKKSTTVSLRSLIQSEEFTRSSSPLTICLGRDIAGSVKLADLAKMPHLLIAGSTGSGKSVCINSIIMSFLYRTTPDELRMILIDPKVVELAEYNGIPHLLMPVVTDPRKAAGALGSAVAEMEKRYQLFASNNVRDIKSYNALARTRDDLEPIPYIAILIDELADLMMVAGKDVEDYICRIAQKARAAGMHLIVATQRPSVDVITGLIKANIPSRIAFAVSSQIDSRTILDAAGAEKLLGMGDMLFLPVGANKPTRIQGTYVKDAEIERVIEEIKSYSDSRYDEAMIEDTEKRSVSDSKEGGDEDGDERDPMLKSAIETVVDAGMASTSLLQRKLKLGYARAARIMDEMEELHVIGPYEGSKPRQVLITRTQFLEMTMNRKEE